MNVDAPSGYAFAGPVRCERRAAQWLLSGTERDTGRPLQLLLAGAAGAHLPASVPDLALRVLGAADDGAAARRWRLEWRDGGIELAVRSVHALRGADALLTAAMPGVKPSWQGRLGWALLLNLLRLPGMTRVLRAMRGAD